MSLQRLQAHPTIDWQISKFRAAGWHTPTRCLDRLSSPSLLHHLGARLIVRSLCPMARWHAVPPASSRDRRLTSRCSPRQRRAREQTTPQRVTTHTGRTDVLRANSNRGAPIPALSGCIGAERRRIDLLHVAASPARGWLKMLCHMGAGHAAHSTCDNSTRRVGRSTSDVWLRRLSGESMWSSARFEIVRSRPRIMVNCRVCLQSFPSSSIQQPLSR